MPDPDVPVNPQGPPSTPQPANSVPPQSTESYKQELWLIAPLTNQDLRNTSSGV